MSTLRLLIRPTLFTVGICGTCFCCTAITEHENRSNRYRSMQNWVQIQKNRLAHGTPKYFEFRQRINDWKNGLTMGEKIAGGTIFVNFLVLCAWRAGGLRPFMTKYFLSQATPGKKVLLTPMILSTFSHSMPLHFILNMYVVYSFSNLATALLGPEQLIGLFFSAGAMSSLTSLALRMSRGVAVPSLGASGAILGVIGYICTTRPDTQLLLLFIPLEAGNVIKIMILVDIIGVLARWRFIDHAAHLGGSLFGIWYAKYGEKMYNKYRRDVVDLWIKMKRDID